MMTILGSSGLSRCFFLIFCNAFVFSRVRGKLGSSSLGRRSPRRAFRIVSLCKKLTMLSLVALSVMKIPVNKKYVYTHKFRFVSLMLQIFLYHKKYIFHVICLSLLCQIFLESNLFYQSCHVA